MDYKLKKCIYRPKINSYLSRVFDKRNDFSRSSKIDMSLALCEIYLCTAYLKIEDKMGANEKIN